MADYKDAKTFSKISEGEELFRFRCAACHSLDAENGLGPGLLNVTNLRDKKWLAEWIKTPDKVLARKDPIATELLKQYNNVLMPNLRLDDKQVAQIIDFLKERAELKPAAEAEGNQ